MAAAVESRQFGGIRPFPRGRDEDVRPAARIPRGTRRQRAHDRGSHSHRLGFTGPHVGHRADRLHARHAGDDEREPNGRVVVLEDTNGDGRMDKRTVFLDGLVLPRALKVLEQRRARRQSRRTSGSCRDTNGDLKADRRTWCATATAVEMGNVEHNANSLLWAMDNWIYTSEGETYLRLKNGKFDVAQDAVTRQWGASQDDAGLVYRNSTSRALHVDIVPTPYFFSESEPASHTRQRRVARRTRSRTPTFPIRPNRGVNRGYTAGRAARGRHARDVYERMRADGVPRRSAACRALWQRLRRRARRQSHQPDHRRQTTARLCEDGKPTTRGVHGVDRRAFPSRLSVVGARTARSTSSTCTTASSSTWRTSRSTCATTSSNASWKRPCTRAGSAGSCTTRRSAAPAPAMATTSAQLVERLSHPNGWWRDTAQRILVERGDASVAPALKKLAESCARRRTRLHAMWTLDGLDRPGSVDGDARAERSSPRRSRIAADPACGALAVGSRIIPSKKRSSSG